MGIYIFTISLVFLLFLYSYKHPSLLTYNVVFAIVSLIICFGYMCGSDWRVYENIYMSYSDGGEDFWWRFLFMEPLYLCTNIIGNLLHLDFWVFYIGIKLLIFYKVVSVFKRFCPFNLLLLAFTFYLGFWGVMNFIDPPFRNMLAAYIFLCSINTIIQRQFKRYVLWILLAALFHYSAIMLIFFYPILNRTYSTRNILVCFVIVNIVLIKPDLIFFLISKILFFIPVIALKIENYTVGAESATLGQGKIVSLGYVLHLMLFALILCSRNRIEGMKNGRFLFNMSVLFVFLFRMGLTALIFSRMQLYVSCFYAITVSCLLYSCLYRYRVLYAFFIFIVALNSNIKQMASLWMVPYSNYLLYYNSEIPYGDRANYNFKYSPYQEQSKDQE